MLMKKSEVFDEMLEKVCEVCEVTAEHILNDSRIPAVVDARILLVQYLERAGLSNDDVALIVLKKTNGGDYRPTLNEIRNKAKSVNKMFNSYSRRCLQSYIFCLMSKELKEYFRARYEEESADGMKELPPLK